MLTVRQHTHGRRLLVLGLLYACCRAAWRSCSDLWPTRRRRTPSSSPWSSTCFRTDLAPLTALLYAAGVVRDEVEEQTLTYLLLRSVPRWAVYTVRLLATLLRDDRIGGGRDSGAIPRDLLGHARNLERHLSDSRGAGDRGDGGRRKSAIAPCSAFWDWSPGDHWSPASSTLRSSKAGWPASISSPAS